MAAYLFLEEKQRIRRYYETLYVTALAHSGDGKAIKKQMDDWERQI